MRIDANSALWVLLMAVWVVAAIGSKRTVRRQTTSSKTVQSVLFVLGFLLLFRPWGLPPLDVRFVPDTRVVALLGNVTTAAGVTFAIWARVTLGGNWSGTVTIKEDHRLIYRGPYRIVRHPIYSGVLLAATGTAIGHGKWTCLIGVAVLFLSFHAKWKTEEQFMIEQFGERYVQYLREVKAVVPGFL